MYKAAQTNRRSMSLLRNKYRNDSPFYWIIKIKKLISHSIYRKNQRGTLVHRKVRFAKWIIIFLVVFVLLNGCASKEFVTAKRKPKAVHGAVFKNNDYSHECTWQFFARSTKKKCVRK